jgi:hypothetical protein
MNRVLAAVSRPRAGWTRQLAGCLDAHSSRFWIRIPARCRLALGCLPVRSCHSFPWASPPPPGPGGTIRTPTSLARAVRTAFPKNNKGNNKHCDVSQETLRTSTYVSALNYTCTYHCRRCGLNLDVTHEWNGKR